MFIRKIIIAGCILLGFYQIHSMELQWRIATGGKVVTAPILVNDRVYWISEDRFLYCTYLSGTILFQTNLQDRVTSSIGISNDGMIICVTARGNVKAINSYGKVVWSYRIDGEPVGNPGFFRDGTIIIGTDHNTVYALSHRGVLKWVIDLPGSIAGQIDVAGNSVFIPIEGRQVMSVDRYSGINWIFHLPGECSGIFPLENSLMISSSLGTIAQVDYDGGMNWDRRYSDNTIFSSPAGKSSECVWILSDNLQIIRRDGSELIFEETVPAGAQHLIPLNSTQGIGLFKKSYILFSGDENSQSGLLPEDFPKGLYGFYTDTAGRLYLLAGGNNWNTYCYGFSTDEITYQPDTYIHDKQQQYNADFAVNHLLSYPSEEIRTSLLSEAESMIRSTFPGKNEPQLLAILHALLQEGIVNPLFEGRSIVNDFPLIRYKAAQLLGEYGTLVTRAVLLDVIHNEWDYSVLEADITALGMLGDDASGSVSEAIISSYKRFQNPPYSLTSAVLESLESLITYTGFCSDKCNSFLISVFRGDYSRQIREKALSILRE